MSEVKLVKVPNVIREVVHVCRPNNLDARKAETFIIKLQPGMYSPMCDCGSQYYRMKKDEI